MDSLMIRLALLEAHRARQRAARATAGAHRFDAVYIRQALGLKHSADALSAASTTPTVASEATAS